MLPNHIFLWGLPGSGKSLALSYIREILPFPTIDLDQFITEKEDATIPEIFEHKGESGFRKIEQESLSNIVKAPPCILSTGGGTPCYGNNAELMLENGVSIWLDVPLHQIHSQLDNGEIRPLFHSQPFEERWNTLHRLYEERVVFYQQAQYKIRVTNADGWLPGLAGLIWALALHSPQNRDNKAFE